MTLSPETATSPLAQAPPDRATLSIEEWARQGLALLFADRQLDMNEMRILRSFFKEVAVRAQAGGVGQGGTPPMEQPEAEGPAPGPQQMNGNTSDFGSGAGEPMDEEG